MYNTEKKSPGGHTKVAMVKSINSMQSMYK